MLATWFTADGLGLYAVVCVGFPASQIVLAGALEPYAIEAMQAQLDRVKNFDMAPPTPPP